MIAPGDPRRPAMDAIRLLHRIEGPRRRRRRPPEAGAAGRRKGYFIAFWTRFMALMQRFSFFFESSFSAETI